MSLKGLTTKHILIYNPISIASAGSFFAALNGNSTSSVVESYLEGTNAYLSYCHREIDQDLYLRNESHTDIIIPVSKEDMNNAELMTRLINLRREYPAKRMTLIGLSLDDSKMTELSASITTQLNSSSLPLDLVFNLVQLKEIGKAKETLIKIKLIQKMDSTSEETITIKPGERLEITPRAPTPAPSLLSTMAATFLGWFSSEATTNTSAAAVGGGYSSPGAERTAAAAPAAANGGAGVAGRAASSSDASSTETTSWLETRPENGHARELEREEPDGKPRDSTSEKAITIKSGERLEITPRAPTPAAAAPAAANGGTGVADRTTHRATLTFFTEKEKTLQKALGHTMDTEDYMKSRAHIDDKEL